ncbi:MAG: hypothetical protein GX365_00825 [Clostridiales bacterium]|nr:hypothetical protein [Clostridiales bacterium]
MKLNEKMSYLQGLVDGLDIDDSTKEGKALIQVVNVMREMVLYVDDLQSQVDELTELTEILDSDLGDVEEILVDCYCDDDYDEDDDCDCCCDDDFDVFDDDELYEVTCPTCEDVVLIDEGILEEGSMDCPNCGESLEFDFDEIELNDGKTDSEEE